MVKCPFCGFDNEDGALFCEQCKSDLSSVPASPVGEPAPAVMPEAIPAAEMFPGLEAAPVAEVPMAAFIDEAPVAEVLPAAEAIPAAIVEAVVAVEPALEVMPLEAFPFSDGIVPAAPIPAAEAIPFPLDAPLPETVPTIPIGTVAAVAAVAAAMPALPAAAAPVAEAIQAVPGFAAATVPAPAPTPPAPTAAALAGAAIAPGSQPRLKVMRGLKIGFEFPIYPEYNYIGRADDKPVDVDLEDQEPPDRVWCSRQHAVIHFDEAAGVITVEDLNSSNGTYVNRARVYPGQKKQLSPNDVVQIGTVHLKLVV